MKRRWFISMLPAVLSLSHMDQSSGSESAPTVCGGSGVKWRWQIKSYGPPGSLPSVVMVWREDERFEHVHVVHAGETAIDVVDLVVRAADERGMSMSRLRQREIEDALVSCGMALGA